MKLTFITGSSLRRVFIEGKKVSMITPEAGNKPFTIDLDKLKEPKMQEVIKKTKADEKLLKELAALETEDEIARDITLDLQREGWRRINKE